MKFIQGTPRNQAVLFPTTLDELISKDNTIRAIDGAFNLLNINQLDFNVNKTENGRPAYHPAVKML